MSGPDENPELYSPWQTCADADCPNRHMTMFPVRDGDGRAAFLNITAVPGVGVQLTIDGRVWLHKGRRFKSGDASAMLLPGQIEALALALTEAPDIVGDDDE
jgi:hypothetical protein